MGGGVEFPLKISNFNTDGIFEVLFPTERLKKNHRCDREVRCYDNNNYNSLCNGDEYNSDRIQINVFLESC